MELPFIKIEGLGNDYIYIDAKSLRRKSRNPSRISRAICDRHSGVGADGLIIMEKTGPASAFMKIYNSDGSEAEFCGNGLRGTALYFKSVYRSKSSKYAISTRWNDYQVEFLAARGNNAMVKASLSSPSFDAEDLGYRGRGRTCLGISVKVDDSGRSLYCVAMPNPHAVIFVDNFDFDWQQQGRALERSPVFKNGINVMFTKVESSSRITVRPWERGAGATLACGSGAAAATIVSCLLEYTKGKVTAVMPGGSVITRWDIADNTVYQKGPTRIAFFGSYII